MTDKQTDIKEMNEEKQRVSEKAAEKRISRDDAEKEVAKEKVQEKTGYSAEALAGVGHHIMKASDGFEKPNTKQAAEGMQHLQGSAVEGLLDKMANGQVAEDIVKAGLGSEFLSTGKAGLEQGARTVLEKSKVFGEGSKMQEMLAQASMYGTGITREEAENMTPEKLKEKVDQYKSTLSQKEQKGQKEQGDSEKQETQSDQLMARKMAAMRAGAR